MSDDKRTYSDGDIEEKIISHLKDKGSYRNEELEDGAVFHNFTPCRENLLNWYSFKKNSTLLEIGAGMGALTGLFCKLCGRVVALEQSPKRAEIIKERYLCENNLQIVCGDINTYSFNEQFDYIVCAGVLEYAGVGSDSLNPHQEMLNQISKLLKNDGKFLLAIENRFGLKYWCGASEDHTGIPFDGIAGYESNGYTDLYHETGVRTFGRTELKQLLDKAGFTEQRWYYPLPDYKFPTAIFTDEKQPDITDIENIKFTYPIESELVADERKLYKDIIDNGVFPFFANSFLVESAKDKLDASYVKYASFKRDYKDKYRISIELDSDDYYIRRAITDKAQKHLQDLINNTESLQKRKLKLWPIEIKDGKVYSSRCNFPRGDEQFKSYLKKNDYKNCIKILETLKQELLKSSDVVFRLEGSNHIEKELDLRPGEIFMGPVLREGYIDLTLLNSFYNDGQLIFFDQEWKISGIPLHYILYRSLVYAYDSGITSIELNSLFNYFEISKAELEIYAKYEMKLLNHMMNSQNCKIFDYKMYHDGLKAIPKAREKYSKLYDQCEQIKNDIEILRENHRQEIKRIEEKQKQEDANRKRLENDLIVKNEEIIKLREENASNIETINNLRFIESDYNLIIHSKMYRMMRFFCRVLDVFLIIPRTVWKNIRAFARMMTHVNWQEIKIAYGYCKNEGIRNAYRHLMRDYHQGELKRIEVEAQPVYSDIHSLAECAVLEIPKRETPLVSIIIPAYNQFVYTYHCIEAIIKNSDAVSYEIILADDNSTDLTKDISQVVSNLIIERTETNVRFLRNCNQAAQKARGNYLLFLNNDTQVQKNWLKPLVDLMESDEHIGMVGSKLVYADGTLQEAGGIIWSGGNGWNYGRNDDAMKPEYNYVREVDYISGASIMIRKELWDRIGGFDDQFAPAYCEDSDLAFQVRQQGYKVMYQPLSIVVHYEGKSNGTDTSQGLKKYQIENSIKLKEKWRDEFKKQYDDGINVFNARERAKEKKTILVIDHYVPQIDKDAGSKTTYQYLKMFVRKGYRVKFIGDNFYQHEPYTTMLQQMGIEVLYGPWYAQHWKEWILENKNSIDFAYLNRPHITIKYIDFLKENTDIKCIYYGHDLHFLRLKREYELTGDESKKKEADEWQEKELYIMRHADMTYYPSCVEVEEIKKLDPTIPVKAITAYVYEKFLTDINADFTKREGIVFVGGFGHPPNEDAVLWFAEKILPLIEQKREMTFYVVGSNPTEKVKAICDRHIVIKGFVSEEELRELYNNCKIVVVPLRYGAGVKGKVVEALYYGTPMVTTSVGAEGIEAIEQIVEIADTEEAFAEAVLSLYDNNEKLSQISDNYQRFVRDKFGIAAVWDAIKSDFE